MKKFKYRFQKILDFRRHQEMEKKRELAKIRSQEQKHKNDIDDILNDRASHLKKEKKELVGQIDAQKLTCYSRYYIRLKKMEAGGRELLARIAEEAEKKRLALVEATKQRKIYEKLKEKHAQKHRQEYEALERKENDEVGQQVFLRNK